MSTYTDEYVNLLAIQYFNKTKAKKEIEMYANHFEQVFNVLNDFVNQFDLDKATGHRLDLIGKIVGQPRIIANAIPKKYFGFGTANTKTFGQGAFFNKGYDTAFTSTQLTDAQYKFYIRARISNNNCNAKMISDFNNSLQDAIQIIFVNRAFVVDNKDMTLTVYIDELFDADVIRVYRDQNLLPTPQGVRYRYYIQYCKGATFGFNDNADARTFGQGKLAKKII